MNSDWQSTIKPVARKLYAELIKAKGQQIYAFVEALEIARRQEEIDETIKSWRDRNEGKTGPEAAGLLTEAEELLKALIGEFGPQRAAHILGAIEREHTRSRWGSDLKAWRERVEMTPEQAAVELGLSVEDVLAIEAGTLSAGPEAMRLIRPALRRVRAELDVGR